MSAHMGSNAVNNGLIFSIDPYSNKSFTPNVSTNLISNGAFQNGLDAQPTTPSSHNALNEVVLFDNPGESSYVLKQSNTSISTEYQIDMAPSASLDSTSFVVSGWYAESPDYVGGSRMFHTRLYSANGAHTSTGSGFYNEMKSVEINGVTWRYGYSSLISPADFTGTYQWYVGYGSAAYSGNRYYTNLRSTQGYFPQLPDLTGSGVVMETPTDITYNGGISFNGTSDYIKSSSTFASTSSFSIELWVKMNDTVDQQRLMSFNGTGTFTIHYSASKYYFHFNPLDGSVPSTATSSTNAHSSGVWRHIVVTNDTNDPTTGGKLFVDGILEGTAIPSVPLSGNLFIGANNGVSLFSNMILGQSRIYDRPLSASEITQNFNANRSRYGV